MAIVEKVGVYRKWLEPIPEKDGKPIPKSEWARKRRHCWIVRWCGTDKKKYGKLFKTRKEAEKYALDLQKQVNLARADRPPKDYAAGIPFGTRAGHEGSGRLWNDTGT